MSEEVKAARSYDSTGRQHEAQERRRAIRAAAKDLFLRQGFAATTVRQIAGAAGVSVALVHAQFGTKVALLKEVYDVTLAGDDRPLAIPDRPPAQRWAREDDPVVILREYAASVRSRHEQLAEVRRVVGEAAQHDPQAKQLQEENDAQRLRGMRLIAGFVARTGRLARDLDEERAAQTLWLLNSGAVWDLCTRDRSWPPEEFEQWLARSYVRLLVEEGPSPG